MLTRRNFLWLIPLLLLLTFPVWQAPLASFLAPRGGYDPNFGKRDKDKHNFLMDNVVILQNQGGRKTAVVRATHARTGKNDDEFILTSVNADLYDKDNEKFIVIADTGTYNAATQVLTLIDNVTVDRVKDHQKLFSDLLYFYSKKKKIVSPGKTRLAGKNVEIKGQSLHYDIDTGHYLIGGRVYCTLQGFVQP